MTECAFCGQEVESPSTKHTIADCAYHLKAVVERLTWQRCRTCFHEDYCPVTCDNNPFIDGEDRDAFYALTDLVWERGRRHPDFGCNRWAAR